MKKISDVLPGILLGVILGSFYSAQLAAHLPILVILTVVMLFAKFVYGWLFPAKGCTPRVHPFFMSYEENLLDSDGISPYDTLRRVKCDTPFLM